MYSSRLNHEITPNAVYDLLESKRLGGIEVLDLTNSNPTRANFSYDEDLILEVVRSGPLGIARGGKRLSI